MDESHYLAIVRAVRGEIDDDTYCSAMFGIPRRLVRHLSAWHRYVLGSQMKWMTSGDSETSRFYIQRIEGFHAPADALGGMSLQQFMTVDTFFVQYAETVDKKNPDGDKQRLCRMVAALYLRPRETYFKAAKQDILVDIDGNATMLSRRADYTLLWGVYLNWIMVRNWLSRAYPLLFPKADGEGGGKGDGKHRRNGWLDTFDAFMGDDVAHLDTYKQMAATDAFRIMNKRIRENMTNKMKR